MTSHEGHEDHKGMKENEISKCVLDAAFKVHTTLGSGLLESVYEVVLAHELRKSGLAVERQKPMPITYEGIRFDEAYRADLVIDCNRGNQICFRIKPSPCEAGCSRNCV